MAAAGTRSRRVRNAALLSALCALVGVTSAAAAAPLSVTKSNVLRDAEPVAQASATKKGKRRAKATTRSAEVPFSSGTSASATGECGGKSHVTGGGFAVAPPLTPPATGIRGTSVVSIPTGKKLWSASGSAFTAPGASGTFTAYARCESNSLGKTIRLSLSGTVPPGQTTSALLDCPGRRHVVGGGYEGTPPASLNGAPAGFRTFILESRRRNIRQWAVTAYTAFSSPVPASFTGYVICERDGKGRSVTQSSTQSQIADNGRTVADPRCGGKRHAVSGGYSIADTDPDLAVAAFFDESHPVGKKGWHVGMWEHPDLDLPAGGATLDTFAYCKKVPKAKRG